MRCVRCHPFTTFRPDGFEVERVVAGGRSTSARSWSHVDVSAGDCATLWQPVVNDQLVPRAVGGDSRSEFGEGGLGQEDVRLREAPADSRRQVIIFAAKGGGGVPACFVTEIYTEKGSALRTQPGSHRRG